MTVFISVVLSTLLRQLFIAPFMLMSAYDLDRLSRKAELFGISFCEKTDGEFLGKLKAALLNAEQSKLGNDFLSSPNFIKIFKSPLTGNRSVAIIAVTERLL